jgi:hypothetical protein
MVDSVPHSLSILRDGSGNSAQSRLTHRRPLSYLIAAVIGAPQKSINRFMHGTVDNAPIYTLV